MGSEPFHKGCKISILKKKQLAEKKTGNLPHPLHLKPRPKKSCSMQMIPKLFRVDTKALILYPALPVGSPTLFSAPWAFSLGSVKLKLIISLPFLATIHEVGRVNATVVSIYRGNYFHFKNLSVWVFLSKCMPVQCHKIGVSEDVC